MNKRVKNKWLKALRSGKYKQTTGALRDEKGYCCLGVLCDLYFKEKKQKFTKNFSISHASLPQKVYRWAGLENEEYPHNPYVNDRNLTSLNDIVGKSFKQIANLIDNHL